MVLAYIPCAVDYVRVDLVFYASLSPSTVEESRF